MARRRIARDRGKVSPFVESLVPGQTQAGRASGQYSVVWWGLRICNGSTQERRGDVVGPETERKELTGGGTRAVLYTAGRWGRRARGTRFGLALLGAWELGLSTWSVRRRLFVVQFPRTVPSISSTEKPRRLLGAGTHTHVRSAYEVAANLRYLTELKRQAGQLQARLCDLSIPKP